jgi:Tfp pilus assembly protein PilX
VIYFDETAWTTNTILTTAMALPTKSQPRYIVEKLEKFRPDDGSEVSGIGGVTEVTPYRITARGVGLTAESTAITQSFYHRNAD